VLTVTFLGTGTSQGIPLIACNCRVCSSADPRDNRLRSSVLIQKEGTTVVIDTGPDFRQQMLREKLLSLDAVVYTHEHKDHIAGMDDVRGFNYILKRPMDVYCTQSVLNALKREFYYVFSEEKYPGIPEINVNILSDLQSFKIKGISFTPIQCMHARMPVLGYRVDDFAYITDANYISDEEKEKLKGLKVLVLNALRYEPHLSHFTLHEAINLVEELKPQKAYFTHISHQLGLHDDVSFKLPQNCSLAFDGLKIKIA
jgi:phosphoribosyl 1,2-cyclic phosphate phosphodiesterase